MVLNDITQDYQNLIHEIEEHNKSSIFITSALTMITNYQQKILTSTDTYIKSARRDPDKTTLYSTLNSLQSSLTPSIAKMTAMRQTSLLVQNISKMEFTSYTVQSLAVDFCDHLNSLMNITETYLSNTLTGSPNTTTFFTLIDYLEGFQKLYEVIYSEYNTLKDLESELLAELPLNDSEDTPIYELDVRSYKEEYNFSSFTDDLHLLSTCLQNLERLVAPSGSSSIYLRKIESGSLKGIFSSDKVDFSIFPDLITSLSNAIRTWRLTDAERTKTLAEADNINANSEKLRADAELTRAQAEELHYKNEGTKLAIINGQIDYVSEKLHLGETKDVEQIQKFLLPLISYIENNPIGMINGVSYDISKEVHLLEEQQKTVE